jgi:hypothetical protein
MSNTQRVIIGAAEVADAFVKMNQEITSIISSCGYYIENHQQAYEKALLEGNGWDEKYYRDSICANLVKREIAQKLQFSLAAYSVSEFFPKNSLTKFHEWEASPVEEII